MEQAERIKLITHMKKDTASIPLKPLLNMKVDELFLKWISLPEQSYLFGHLQRIPYELTPDEPDKGKNEKVNGSPLSESVNGGNKPLFSPRRIVKEYRPAPACVEQNHHTQKDPTKTPLKKPRTPISSLTSKSANPSSKVNIPQFYFPNGDPSKTKEADGFEKLVSAAFSEKWLKLEQMDPVCKACGCPLYWKSCLFKKAAKSNSTTVTKEEVVAMWKTIVSEYHDDASRFIALLAKDGKNFVEFDDFLPLMRDVVDTHPGLTFLKESPEFHTRYMNTVIARIFYTVNRSWSGKITANELRRTNFLSVLQSLETEQDINCVTDYFSYEHFYVIYCKFWELDSDHDLMIDCNDLARHGDGVLSARLISIILSGAIQRCRDPNDQRGLMSYIDFIWFLLSEEDKTTKTSIEYWFRCMDLDGDGYISLYEMEYFYEEQIQKLELLDIEPLPFTDCACAMLDMIRPSNPDCISLTDLKKCGLAGIFFDTFLNVEKYLEHEQKDPFANALLENEDEAEVRKQSDWEKYAAEEYELLVAEEQANEADSLANAIDEDSHGPASVTHYDEIETDW